MRSVRTDKAHTLLRASQAMTLASLATSMLDKRRLSGALGLDGALALRFAIMEAGRISATDPRATFEPQRARAADAAKPERQKRMVN